MSKHVRSTLNSRGKKIIAGAIAITISLLLTLTLFFVTNQDTDIPAIESDEVAAVPQASKLDIIQTDKRFEGGMREKERSTLLSIEKRREIMSKATLDTSSFKSLVKFEEDITEFATNNGIKVAEDLLYLDLPFAIKGRLVYRKQTVRYLLGYEMDAFNLTLPEGDYEVIAVTKEPHFKNPIIAITPTNTAQIGSNGLRAIPLSGIQSSDPFIIKRVTFSIGYSDVYNLSFSASIAEDLNYWIIIRML